MSIISEYPVIHEQEVAWGDMDALGHVNNVIYYRYVESARITYLNLLNVFDYEVSPVVLSNNCKYLKPAFYPDRLKVATRIEELRRSACRMSYRIWSESQQQVIAEAEAVVVFVHPDTMQKAAIPEQLRLDILNLEAQVGHILEK